MADRSVVHPAEGSTGDIVRSIIGDIQEIIHSEVRLAKAELTETARKAGKAGGLLGGAAICGLFATACFVATVVAALALVMPVWLAALLMGFFLTCTAFGMYLGGRGRWTQVNPVPGRTVQTLKDDVAWVKHRTS